jgi:hypothetical protein
VPINLSFDQILENQVVANPTAFDGEFSTYAMGIISLSSPTTCAAKCIKAILIREHDVVSQQFRKFCWSKIQYDLDYLKNGFVVACVAVILSL